MPAAMPFYQTSLGQMAARLVAERIAAVCPHVRGLDVLGIGDPAPYVAAWRGHARRCLSLWPPHAACHSPAAAGCVAEDDALPFPDLSFDLVLLVHGLEASGHARTLLREVWRVLKDDGRLLAVVPNRRGAWALAEGTPFGHGQPYSPGQISRLLTASLFHVEHRDGALFAPPVDWAPVRAMAPALERIGRAVAPRFAGVTLTVAGKDAWAAVPLRPAARRRLVLADA